MSLELLVEFSEVEPPEGLPLRCTIIDRTFSVANKGLLPRRYIVNYIERAVDFDAGITACEKKRFATAKKATEWADCMVNKILKKYTKRYLLPGSYTITVDNEGVITRKDICDE